MKTIYKSILISLLAVTANNVFATEFEIKSDEVLVEPRLQLTLLPGIERPVRKPLAMHMVETAGHYENLLNLNSSLVKPNKTFETEKYFDDIEVTSNNLLEIRF